MKTQPIQTAWRAWTQANREAFKRDRIEQDGTESTEAMKLRHFGEIRIGR